MKYKYMFVFAAISLFSLNSCEENKKEKDAEESKKEKNEVKKNKTPEAVKITFKSKYPNENDPDWQLDDMGNYESTFKKEGIHYRADFSPDGNWIETETSIDKEDLPEIIKEKIKSDFGDYELAEIEKVEHHSKGMFYDVEFKQKGKNKDVEFNSAGEIIN